MPHQQVYFESLCGQSVLWDYDLTWNTSTPRLTRCFHQTVLNWIPIIFLWTFAIYEQRRTFRIDNKAIPRSYFNASRIVLAFSCITMNAIQLIQIVNLWYNSLNPPLVADIISPLLDIASFALILLFLYYQRLRGVHTSAVIWLYLLLKTLCTLPIAYHIWIDAEGYNFFESVLYNIYLPVIFLLLVLCSFADGPIVTYDNELSKEKQTIDENKPSPETKASFLNRLTFWWFNDMALLGWKKALMSEDLWSLPNDMKTENLCPNFEAHVNEASQKIEKKIQTGNSGEFNGKRPEVPPVKSDIKKVNIVPILARVFGPYFLVGSVCKLIHDLLQFVTPQLLKYLINFIEDGTEEPVWHGFLIAFAMFLVSVVQSLFLNQYFYRMFVTGMKINSTLTGAIYRKSLNLGDQARKDVTSGEIVNLMAVDSKRFLDLVPSINLIWSAPLQVIFSIYFLYLELGYSALCGLALMILMLPLNGVIAKLSRNIQIKLMKQKDERVKFMNEILNGIKILKFYAWEESFLQHVTSFRQKELHHLRNISYLGCVSTLLWIIAPMLVSVTTFAVYVLIQGGTLTAQKAFVSLSLFNILRFPMAMLPELITFYIMASVSVKRINNFLSYDNLDPYVTRNDEIDAITVKDGQFTWSKKKEAGKKQDGNNNSKAKVFFKRHEKVEDGNDGGSEATIRLQSNESTLTGIDFRVKPQSFVAIVGSVGSGKSSLLSALLGEMERVKGRVNINGNMSIAFVSQQAWIQNSTLRDNILFGKAFDKTKYNRVIAACALAPDIAYLPGGDATEIGEKGINLSGGQKQRVNLARACYSDSDLYIMDDPLSAVDAHVAKHIFDKVLSSESGILRDKTRVLVTNKLDILSKVDKIIVLKNGSISEMGTFKELMDSKSDLSDLITQFTNQNVVEETDAEESMKESVIRKQSIARAKSLVADDKQTKLIETESSETGKVQWKVYLEYFRMVSFLGLIVIVLCLMVSNGFSLGSNVWLSAWSNDQAKGNVTMGETEMRLGFYTLFGVLQAVTTLIGYWILVVGTLRASSGFHRDLLHRILRSPMSFFDTTPSGRIVNRFSKDIDTVDSVLPQSLRSWLICFFQVVSTFIIISIQTPLFIVVLIPIGLVYGFIQRVYVASSRQLKRLESVSRSPIYSHFGETLNGVNTIRAYDACDRFIAESAGKVDHNLSCYYPNVIANRWLAVRLEFCGNLIILASAVFAVLARETLGAGEVGLSVSYALSVTNILNWLVRMTSELETNIVAVERILEYCRIPSEADWSVGKIQPKDDWPRNGAVKFDNYQTRYREGTDLVLKGISADIKPKEKIGIVGRTGAGKSTVTLSLFRLIEPTSGSIHIDEYNISDLPLHPLRSRLAIIPQDPVLFSGNLRFNLDPFNLYKDEEIWNSLSHAHLKDFVTSLGQGLEYPIAEEGNNLSVGQRQLVCLARALLKRPKVLFLDEATAAIDLETDSIIQNTIRSEFHDCTILTIAHRLNTIMDSDRVLVLDKGKIAEFDSPNNLLENKETIFYSLAKEANLVS